MAGRAPVRCTAVRSGSGFYASAKGVKPMNREEAAAFEAYENRARELEGPSFDTHEDILLQRLWDYSPSSSSGVGTKLRQGSPDDFLPRRSRRGS